MSLTAIVPVWNNAELLRRLLASLDAQTLRVDAVVAVDNGSTDGAPEIARQAGARVISMGRNAGFAAAVNQGIREAGAGLLAVLNTDVELAPEYLALLSRSIRESDAWFGTGKILDATSQSRIDATFDVLSRGGTAYRVGNGQHDGDTFSRGRAIWSAPWTAAMFRSEVFDKVGLLDESLESYLEDVDFGLRCARAGLAGRYVPEAVAWHRGSASLGAWHPDTVRRIARNQLYLLARHFSSESLHRYAWAIWCAQTLWGCLAVRHGTGMAWLRGKWQGFRGWRKIRGTDPFPDRQLHQLMVENERLIREFQADENGDWYWKIYFRFAGTEAK